MNWDAIGATGETLGAVAVLITLIYLASQIRQSNRFESAKHLDVHMDRIRQFHYEIGTDADSARIWHSGLAGDELNVDEQRRFESLATVRVLIQRDAWLRAQILRGVAGTDPEVYLQILAVLIAVNPGLRNMWKNRYYDTRALTTNREFVEKVESLIVERLDRPVPEAPLSF